MPVPKRTSRAVALTTEAIAAFGRKAKGARLTAGSQLTRLEQLCVGQRHVYLVEGDTGRYRTTLRTYGATPDADCTCPARGICSHMLTVKAEIEGAIESTGAVVA